MRELEPRLFSYIWRHSKRDQIAICAVVLASLPFYFASLDLPKRIVNDAITGRAFSHGEETASFLEIKIDWPSFLGGGRTELFEGFHVDRLHLLLGLSLMFLGLVIVNGAFKFWINLRKGILGERMLRRLRFQLFALMLRFSAEAQSEVKSSETATIIRDEVEPIGSFIGDAIVVPAQLGTQALTALAFILMQNVWLGLVAGGMVGVQMTVIPRLRRQIIVLSRKRQIASRAFAGRVAEVLDGLPAVTLNNTGRWERAEIGGRLYALYDLRLRIYRRKFAVKYLNNLIAQITPFLFYAIGGVFALKGELDIGQLVAVLAAYRDLPPPLKELIDWDQQRLDVEVKYETVAAHFGPDRLTPYQDDDGPGLRLGSPLSTEDLTIRDPRGGSPIDIAPIDKPLPARLALVPPGAVSQEFARVVAGLAMPRGGTVRIGHYDLATLPRSIFSSRLAFAGNTPVLFPGSIRDNLLYGLRVKPQASRRLDFTKQSLREALRTGNPLDSITDPWIDFAALGVEDAAGLDRRLVEILSRLGLGDDLYRYGLGTLSSVTHESEAGQRFILAREHLREHFEQQGLAGLVIPFSRGAFNDQATLGENLLFGVPRDTSLTEPLRLAAAVPFRTALAQTRLLDDLDRMGVEIARNLSEIFKDVPPGHPLFRRFSLITPEMVPEYEARLSRLAPTGRLPEEDSKAFLALSLAYVEPRMRFGLVDPILKSRVVGARSVVQDAFGGQDGCDIETYDPARINPRASVLDNILFGRIDTARMHSEEIIQREVLAVFREFDLEDGIRRRGLERQVGNRGLLLPERVRVRVGLTRALLRQPEILVIDRVTDHLEGGVQTLLDVVEEMIPSATLLASVSSEVEVHAFPDALRLVPSDQPMRNAAE